MNIRTWNTGSGTVQTHEVWKLRTATDIAPTLLLTAMDTLGGIKAPDGLLWVKVFEILPLEGWEPA